jgi:hypothetical protein
MIILGVIILSLVSSVVYAVAFLGRRGRNYPCGTQLHPQTEF